MEKSPTIIIYEHSEKLDAELKNYVAFEIVSGTKIKIIMGKSGEKFIVDRKQLYDFIAYG